MPNFNSISFESQSYRGGWQKLPLPLMCVCYPNDPMRNSLNKSLIIRKIKTVLYKGSNVSLLLFKKIFTKNYKSTDSINQSGRTSRNCLNEYIQQFLLVFQSFDHADLELIPCTIEILGQNFTGGILHFLLICFLYRTKNLKFYYYHSTEWCILVKRMQETETNATFLASVGHICQEK